MKKDSGITIIALAITIVVMLILVSIVTISGIDYIRNSKNNRLTTELQQVQHAILQQYSLYNTTGNEKYLVGNPITREEIITSDILPGNIFLADISDDPQYYRLSPEDLGGIGIYGSKDTYIINYVTGEVINETTNRLNNAEQTFLYIRSK